MAFSAGFIFIPLVGMIVYLVYSGNREVPFLTTEALLMPLSELRQLVIIVKPFRAEAVLQVIASFPDVRGWTVREAKGYGRQKGYLDRYRGSEYGMAYLPKVEFQVWVDKLRYEELVEQIVRAARTGRIGDGKIMTVAVPTIASFEF
jgi:nitrogen regulatory protein PII